MKGKWLGLLLSVVGLSQAVAQTGYSFQDLGTLPNGDFSRGKGINDGGQVVGYSTNGSTLNFGFVWSNGTMTNIGALGNGGSIAEKINNLGQVTGFSKSGNSGQNHAFRWQPGTGMTNLNYFGFPQLPDQESRGFDISDSGAVVGWSHNTNPIIGAYHAFNWTSGVMYDLGTLQTTPYDASAALAINTANKVVGYNLSSGSFHAIYRDQNGLVDLSVLVPYGVANDINDNDRVVGVVRQTSTGPFRATVWTKQGPNWTSAFLPSLGGAGSNAIGINNSGVIIGKAQNAAGLWKTCVWDVNGVPFDLTAFVPAGWDFWEVNDINASGQIVGTATNPAGQYRAVLLNPNGAPPGVFTLDPPSPGVAGQVNVFTARNGVPGSMVYFIDDTSGQYLGGLVGCPTLPLLSISGSRAILGKATVDPAGRADLRVKIPANFSGRTRVYVAVDVANCLVSNVVTWTYL